MGPPPMPPHPGHPATPQRPPLLSPPPGRQPHQPRHRTQNTCLPCRPSCLAPLPALRQGWGLRCPGMDSLGVQSGRRASPTPGLAHLSRPQTASPPVRLNVHGSAGRRQEALQRSGSQRAGPGPTPHGPPPQAHSSAFPLRGPLCWPQLSPGARGQLQSVPSEPGPAPCGQQQPQGGVPSREAVSWGWTRGSQESFPEGGAFPWGSEPAAPGGGEEREGFQAEPQQCHGPI